MFSFAETVRMARAPIKERIVVIRYKPLSEETYRMICDALGVFLSKVFPDEDFKSERLNRPEITVPKPTIGDDEPDWTKVKISVDRPSRFWNASRSKCVQFFKDSLTVNLISHNESTPWNHDDLFAFFEVLLPFFSKHGKYFTITKSSIDYQNVLDHNQLSPYIVNNGQTLELARILKGNVLGQSIDGATFTPPIIHNVSYVPDHEKNDVVSFPARLDVQIVVPELRNNLWSLHVLFSAFGNFPGFDKEPLLSYLKQMHDVVTKGFQNTFSDEIVFQKEREA